MDQINIITEIEILEKQDLIRKVIVKIMDDLKEDDIEQICDLLTNIKSEALNKFLTSKELSKCISKELSK